MVYKNFPGLNDKHAKFKPIFYRYCLFDTYDLFVEGGARASEKGLGISKITKLGDKVNQNI